MTTCLRVVNFRRITVASLRVKAAKVVLFLQIMPIVQIVNSITYVESGWGGPANPPSSVFWLYFVESTIDIPTASVALEFSLLCF